LVAGGGFEPLVRIDPLKLLILQYAKLARLAEKALLSYTSSLCVEPLPLLLTSRAFHAIVAVIALSLFPKTESMVSGLLAQFQIPIPM
jgi:hypothetical protein